MNNSEAATTMDRTQEKRLQPAPKPHKPDGLGTTKRTRIARSAILVAVVTALSGSGYYGWRAWNGTNNAAAAYTTAIVQRGDIEEAVTATGILQPRDYVDVGTQVSGQLKKVHVNIGAVVKAGDLLAEIDPTVYKTRVDADRAQINTLTAQLSDREAQLALAEDAPQPPEAGAAAELEHALAREITALEADRR